MLIQIWHHTRYEYNHEVNLGIHKLYLIPQHRPYFRIEHQKFSVNPIPEGRNFRQDLAGNWYKQCWFFGEYNFLEIQSEWIFKLQNFNPFGFILDRSFEENGWHHPLFQFSYEDKTSFLIPFLQENEEFNYFDFLNEVKKSSSGLVDFIVKLTRIIHQNWTHEVRNEENLWPAQSTFEKKRGSCRDLAWMQMEMLREIGLATRFVSGYAFNPELEGGHELHAWLEIFLPGASWVGVDPSLGLFTDHTYIPLASHPDPKRTMPVQGSFSGIASSQLKTSVDIKLLYK